MKERLGLLLIHTYTLCPPRCLHGPVVHFSCVHVGQKSATRSSDANLVDLKIVSNFEGQFTQKHLL